MVSAELESGLVVAGSSGVAVATSDEAHLVFALKGFFQEPLELSVGRCDLESGFYLWFVVLEVGGDSSYVRGYNNVVVSELGVHL